eukprot:1189244-Pleurochrysis_carterae.AAC.1
MAPNLTYELGVFQCVRRRVCCPATLHSSALANGAHAKGAPYTRAQAHDRSGSDLLVSDLFVGFCASACSSACSSACL